MSEQPIDSLIGNVLQVARQSAAVGEVLKAKGIATREELDELLRSTEALNKKLRAERRPAGRLATGIVLAILVALVVAPRLPFLANTLIGEEGEFAFLVASPVPSYKLSPDGTPQALSANVDGTPVVTPFQHAIMPYYIIEAGLGALTRRMHILDLDFVDRTRAVRASYLLLFLGGALGLLYLASSAMLRPAAWFWKSLVAAVPIYVLTTPLAFGASIQPQIDGSVGVLLAGLAAWLLVSGENRQEQALRFLFAGLLVGMGRAEWVVALFGVMVATTVVCAVLRVRIYPALVPLFVGLLVGVVVSLIASAEAYADSFRMTRVLNLQDVVSLTREILIYTLPVIALSAIGVVALLRQRGALSSKRIGIIIALGTGIAIFAGFTLSGYRGDGFPRHFTPALMFVAYSVMALLLEAPLRPLRWWSRISALAVTLGLAMNLLYLVNSHRQDVSITSYPGHSFTQAIHDYEKTAAAAAGTNAVMLESVSFWLYYPNINFISRDLGEEGIAVVSAAAHVTDRIGKPDPDRLPASEVMFGDQIALVGLDLQRERDSLRWRAEWKLESDVDEDYAVYLHFVDAQGRLFARDHSLVVDGRGTTGRKRGDALRDEYVIPLDPEIRDSHLIRAGVYKLAGLAKFPVVRSTLPVLDGHDGVAVKVPDAR